MKVKGKISALMKCAQVPESSWHLNGGPLPLLRVAKCQFFYTEQNRQKNLPEEKRANQDSFGTKLNKTDKKDTIGEQLFIYLQNKTSPYQLMLYKSSPKKA